MAIKRMFSLSVVDTDKFLEMPLSSRLLYYELGMRADDDGFVDNWKKILLFTGLKEDDMKILIAKQFVIPFESGVIVIRHWRLNNYLQNDRIKPTIYQEELSKLTKDKNNVYNMYTDCILSIEESSIEENSIDKNNILCSKNNELNLSKNFSKNDKDIILKENIKCIIDYLNESIGSKYKYTTKSTINLIKARFNEGYKLDDFYDVIDKKVNEWLNTDMQKYLRPETLFGNKFESYLNGKVFIGKPKSNYSSQPTFDNTANHDIKIYHLTDEEFDKLSHEEKINTLLNDFSAVADMTKKQREFYNQYCVVHDWDK